jgi:[protein]-arginine 3-hydroxylase / protease
MSDFVHYIRTRTSVDMTERLYLAQQEIFRHFSTIEADVLPLPDFIHLLGSDIVRSMFMGPLGTITPLHSDPYDNLLCQVVGLKYVRLHPPEDASFLYLEGHQRGKSLSRSFLPDDLTLLQSDMYSDSYPDYDQASKYEVILKPGDCLYIPRGWFHFVKSMTASISIAHFTT